MYDRRFALNKKLREADVTLEELQKNSKKMEAPEQEQVKKEPAPKSAPKKAENTVEEKPSESREVMVVNKQVPVIMKPIEINFENFSIKLNGVPKKISVNPDTNAIEIDL